MNNKNKKAQIIGQVMMFALAAIIFGLIITYGYKAVTNLMEKGSEISMATFKTDFENGVDAIKRDYGSVQKLELTLPTKFNEICIADPNNPGTLANDRPLLYNKWRTSSENIFFTPPAQQPFKINDITIPNGYFCIKKTGKILLRLEGQGDKAQVTPG